MNALPDIRTTFTFLLRCRDSGLQLKRYHLSTSSNISSILHRCEYAIVRKRIKAARRTLVRLNHQIEQLQRDICVTVTDTTKWTKNDSKSALLIVVVWYKALVLQLLKLNPPWSLFEETQTLHAMQFQTLHAMQFQTGNYVNCVCHLKDPYPWWKDRYDISYKIPCKDCNEAHVGNTSRSIHQRQSEHKASVCLGNTGTNAIAARCWQFGHWMNWTRCATIKTENKYCKRHMIEAIVIWKKERSIKIRAWT